MDDTKKLILLLVGAVILIVAAFWLITPLRSEGDLLSKMFGGGISVSEPTATGPELTIDLTREYTVEVETSEGMFTMVLYDNNAPFTVNNFVELSNEGFYDGSKFHRIVPGFIIQAGRNSAGAASSEVVADEINADSLGLNDVTVAAAPWLTTVYNANDSATADFSPENLAKYKDYTVKEFFHEILGYTYRTDVTSVRAERWYVGMANSGPNTATSEFFVITASLPQRHLDGRYTIFGKVTDGFDVVQAIEAKPANSVTITDVTVTSE